MSQDILVSVVIPTYGRADYVKEALDSVVSQTYKNIEIIVVDDNANNLDIREKIARITAGIPNCKLVQNSRNLGGALTRNEGIKASRGELVSFLDDDDTYEATRIEEVVSIYKKNMKDNIGLIYTYCYSCDERMNIIGEYRVTPSDNPLYKHMCNCLCATSQWTLPKLVFNKIGMFEKSPCKQDSIMLLKVLGAGYKVLCVEKCLSRYREHSSGVRISGNYARLIEGEQNFLFWLRKYYSCLTRPEAEQVEFYAKRRIMLGHAGARNIGEALSILSEIRKMNCTKPSMIKDLITIFVGQKRIQRYRELKKRITSINI